MAVFISYSALVSSLSPVSVTGDRPPQVEGSEQMLKTLVVEVKKKKKKHF